MNQFQSFVRKYKGDDFIFIHTPRLILMPLRLEHQEWLPFLYEQKEYFPIYCEQLAKTPQLYGFGPWLVLEKNTRTIIGDIGFKGLPQNGIIDIEREIEMSGTSHSKGVLILSGYL